MIVGLFLSEIKIRDQWYNTKSLRVSIAYSVPGTMQGNLPTSTHSISTHEVGTIIPVYR